MKKIAVINDLSGLGKCSLTAALPVISVMGVQACPFPTAVLSNQTGYSSYFCDDFTDRMDAIKEEWKKRGFHPDGIYTGFLAGEAQAEKILEFMDCFCSEDTMVLVDPVMGDQGRAYPVYSGKLCQRMRQLSERAAVITPNLTEALLLLYGEEKMEEAWDELSRLSGDQYLEKIQQYGAALEKEYHLSAVVITGIEYETPQGVHQIGNLVREEGCPSWFFAAKLGGSYSGTGDLFASVLSAGMVRGIPLKKCTSMAVSFLEKAIQATVAESTDRNDGVCFEKYLKELA